MFLVYLIYYHMLFGILSVDFVDSLQLKHRFIHSVRITLNTRNLYMLVSQRKKNDLSYSNKCYFL